MAKELVFGTTNPGKIAQIQGALEPLGIVVRGIGDFDISLDVEEDGETAQENARKKATTYVGELGRTVFSMDNALYLDGLADADQPGLHVRRIPGSASDRPSDDELLTYYSALIKAHGGKMTGRWEFALAIARPDGTIAETIIISPRQFVSTPSQRVVAGYPLESIQVDPESGRCISDMSESDQAEFWQRSIGGPLSKFVAANL